MPNTELRRMVEAAVESWGDLTLEKQIEMRDAVKRDARFACDNYQLLRTLLPYFCLADNISVWYGVTLSKRCANCGRAQKTAHTGRKCLYGSRFFKWAL